MRDNILLITDGFPFDDCERGFLETEFEELTQHFQMNVLANNTTGKITHDFPKDVPCWRYCFEKLKILRLPMQLRYPEVREEITLCWGKNGLRKNVMRTLRILVYSLRAEGVCKQIEEIVKKRSIDLIYTYWCTQATVAAARLKKQYPQLKIITRFHGYDLYKERALERWQPLRPFIASNVDLLVFACKRGKEYFLNEWPGEWEKRSVVSYLGTKQMQRIVSQNANKLVVVSCSNLITLKRVNLIIEALALCPDEVAVEWHHIGDGCERTRLEKLAVEKLKRKPNMNYRFWGQVQHDALEKIYEDIGPDLFITTSSTEGGVPVSAQEAIGMGIPVIGTDVGGMAELVEDGRDGFLLPLDVSAQQICEKLLEFVALPQSKQHLLSQEAFSRWQERFCAKHTAKEFAAVLMYIMKNTSKRGIT